MAQRCPRRSWISQPRQLGCGSPQANARRAATDRYALTVLADKLADFIDEHGDTEYGVRLRRALDVVVASTTLVATAPIAAAAAIAVASTLGRPVLFSQERAGQDGAPFVMHKFRSMRAPKVGEENVAHDAARLAPLGKFLRASSIDELPTLINVLRGDMHLVGPRPLLLRYNARYSPAQARRLDVKPGITGWAQVNGRNRISWDEKFDLDAWYVDHRSLSLDLKILWQTAARVLARNDVEHDGHATMPEFMGEQVEGNAKVRHLRP